MRSLLLASLVSLSSIVSAQTLTTTQNGGFVLTGFTGANTMFCDITVTAPGGIYISQIDTRMQLTPPGTFEVYRTAAGVQAHLNRTNAAVWRKLATSPVAVVANPTVCVLSDVCHLPPGTYGFAFHYITIQAVYTNPANPVVLPVIYSNADLSIDCTNSVATNSLPGNAFNNGGTSAFPRLPNLTIHYSLTGHATDFSATPAAPGLPMVVHGVTPLLVQFTDESATSDPSGLINWQWDFGDGSPLVTGVPSPQYTYTTCGDFNVTLTTTDVLGNVARTKTAFVRTDQIVPSFTYAKIGNPAQFQFTNTSTATATTFAWDLDGIPGTDSTSANPTFSYAAGCAPVNVTLTASNSCRNEVITRPVVPQPFIETLFNANNAGTAGGSVLFDANVTGPDGIEVCAVTVNCNVATAGTPIQVTVYTRPGTYVGSQLVAAGWTNHGSVFGIAQPINRETTVTLATPIYLAPGSVGVAINVTGVGLAYSGTGANPAPGALSYSNPDVTLSLGHTTSALFSGTAFTPRIFNGRLSYKTIDQGLAAYFKFASGCAGTLGVPGNIGVAAPKLGQNMSVNFTNIPAAGIVFYGFSNTLFQGAIPLPIDLAPLGGPGCPILIDTAFNAGFFLSAGGTINWTVPIPNSGVFLGVHFFTQMFSFDTVNALGGVTSDGATALIGNT